MPRRRLCKEVAEKRPKHPKAAATERAEDEDSRYVRRLSLAFVAEVAIGCQLPIDDVKKVLQSLRQVLVKRLRAHKRVRIPSVCLLRLKTLKARAAGKIVLFGSEKKLKARPERKKIVGTTLKSFQLDCVA